MDPGGFHKLSTNRGHQIDLSKLCSSLQGLPNRAPQVLESPELVYIIPLYDNMLYYTLLCHFRLTDIDSPLSSPMQVLQACSQLDHRFSRLQGASSAKIGSSVSMGE